MHAVKALAADDIWAVGEDTTCHWDGTTWTRVPLDDPFGPTTLVAVDALSPTDVWAVGQRTYCEFQQCDAVTVMARWDGTAWHVAPLQVGPATDLVVLAADDAWVVGTSYGYPVIGHWDGNEWQPVLTPNPLGSASLYGVADAGAGRLWAVGGVYENGDRASLVLEAPSRTQGHVVGETGRVDTTITWFGPVSGSIQTFANSDYALAALPEGSYNLVASATGCAPQQATVEVVAGATVRQDFALCATPGPTPTRTVSPPPATETPTATPTEPPAPTVTPTRPPAQIAEWEPLTMQVTQRAGQLRRHTVQLHNMLRGPLVWSSYEGRRGCADPHNQTWLHLTPDAGTTPRGGMSALTIYLDTRTLAPGTYAAHLCVIDSAGRTQGLPLRLRVLAATP